MRNRYKWRTIKSLGFGGLAIIVFGLMNIVGCGGDGDGRGGGGQVTGPFTMTNYFPLTSSWQTDNWTLFVDVGEHDVNGVMTKAMADTRNPSVFYWTNTNGLRLHGHLDEEGTLTFDPPIIFAGITCTVGDKHEGTFTFDEEEYAYEIELVGVEDVSVPAGDFEDCLKFSFFLYPTSELPSLYGSETFWLAEDVGFVKAIGDENAVGNIFANKGETRQLLSYHITPSDLSGDELAIHEYFKRQTELWMAEDLAGTMDMISDDYFDRRCRDKDAVEESWENAFENNSDWIEFVTIEDIEINGDDAFVLREYLDTYVNDASGEREWWWNRELRRFRKEGGEWKSYGAHLGIRPDWYDVYVRHTSYDGEKYPIGADFIDCADSQYIDTTAPISTFTISGPPGSGLVDVDLMPYWNDTDPSGWLGFWNTESLTVGVSGFYTFRVENQTGDYFVYTDYLEAAPHMALPIIVYPADGASNVPVNVTLDWNPVDGAETYRVDMNYSDDSGNTWQGMPNVYTDDTQATVTLNAGNDYQWRVRARQLDEYGEVDGESRSDWSTFSAPDV